ncbi:MAG: hypothetical protein NT135_01835 [Candidatus Berkelbacteria bacterium]|nr:hypothetical protein [Candidatus Berkelbacteria bacterium]
MVKYQNRVRMEARWASIKGEMCPKDDCDGKLKVECGRIICSTCGAINPKRIKNIDERCSFCGTKLEEAGTECWGFGIRSILDFSFPRTVFVCSYCSGSTVKIAA